MLKSRKAANDLYSIRCLWSRVVEINLGNFISFALTRNVSSPRGGGWGGGGGRLQREHVRDAR